MKRFYGLMAIIGTVAPWFYFGSYFADGDRETFGDALFASPLMVGFVADLSISIVVFLVWSLRRLTPEPDLTLVAGSGRQPHRRPLVGSSPISLLARTGRWRGQLTGPTS